MTTGAQVWLTGGSGMLASALRDEFDRLGVSYVATDAELDITQRERVLAAAAKHRPHWIINGAAFTRVDDAEKELDVAQRVNGDGPAFLAEAAREHGANLLHFSTDYVFAGDAAAPYREQDPVAPRTAYGKTKLEGEQRALSVHPAGSFVLRTSWLFGENGPNFVRTMVNLMRERETLKVVHDQLGRPTYTRDLAAAALELVGLARPRAAAPGVYHFANAGEVSWHGFTLGIRAACERLEQALRVREILPVTTAEFPRPAPRPAYSVLDTSRIERALGRAPRPWQTALEHYLAAELAPPTTRDA